MNSYARDTLRIAAQAEQTARLRSDMVARLEADFVRTFNDCQNEEPDEPSEFLEPQYFDVPTLADGFSNVRLTLYPDGERGLLYTHPGGRRAGTHDVSDFLVALVKTAAGRSA
jgi:hypothetical protein